MVFGDALPTAAGFVAALAGSGVERGLIGPREVPRLWERHVLNCAVIGEAMPKVAGHVVDVGSGAGLPGVALAIARPDLRVTLVEPMLRRTEWLLETVVALGIPNIDVRRARAEEVAGDYAADYVTARAVAALDRLLPWCAPLAAVGGQVVAMKGSSATAELDTVSSRLPALGLGPGRILEVGAEILAEPTTVVVLPKIAEPAGRSRTSHARGRHRATRRS